MIALIRLAVFGLAGLTVLYVLALLYARSLRRERLEKRWEAKGGPGERAVFVRKGMARYNRTLARRLVWLIYILPVTLVSVIVYLLNFA